MNIRLSALNLDEGISGSKMVSTPYQPTYPPHYTFSHTHTHLFLDTANDLHQTLKHQALLFDPIMELWGPNASRGTERLLRRTTQ